jgi:hypothetical protein
MLSKKLLYFSFYKLCKNLYNNYLSLKYKDKDNQKLFTQNNKLLKQNIPLNYNVSKIKYNYEFRK